MDKQFDYLLAGLGVAGISLWCELEKRGLSCMVADAGDPGAASRVAPGVVNPLAGKRLNPSWRVSEQLPVALDCYRALSRLFGETLLHEVPIIRVIKDAAQREYFDKRLTQPDASHWIGREYAPGRWPGLLEDPLGSFEATASGYLDVARTCALVREKLLAEGRLLEGRVEASELECGSDGVRWRGMTFRKVIFAEGWLGSGNPFFPEVPFKPAKGEMLTLLPKTPQPGFPRAIVNRGKWILPMPDGTFRAGSSYSWDRFDDVPTEAGRATILSMLGEFVKVDFTIVDQKAGVRPIVKDYRPVLGCSTTSPCVAIMNGLGSKGVLAGPWLAGRLLDHLERGAPLGEMDVARFR
jgi:glycine/D-amino acid oxidase-like deaminating enzyme